MTNVNFEGTYALSLFCERGHKFGLTLEGSTITKLTPEIRTSHARSFRYVALGIFTQHETGVVNY